MSSDRKISPKISPKGLFDKYRRCLVLIEATSEIGDVACGTGFHIGSGIIITARHVLENCSKFSIVSEVYTLEIGVMRLHYHPDDSVDIVAIATDFADVVVERPVPFVEMGYHLDDWINDEAFYLLKVLTMGYPPIPTSNRATLVAATGEVISVIDRYDAKHPHFIVSSVPRSGFSGAPVICEWNFLLGVITNSLSALREFEQIGYTAVLTVEPIYTLLEHHDLSPEGAYQESRR